MPRFASRKPRTVPIGPWRAAKSLLAQCDAGWLDRFNLLTQFIENEKGTTGRETWKVALGYSTPKSAHIARQGARNG